MTVYIEYAFLENFFFDWILLFLSMKWAKLPLSKGKITLSASVGGVFAVLFPLLKLTKIVGLLFKFLLGALLCLLVSPPLKTKKDRGRYALNFVYFLLTTFFFGGALTFLLQEIFPKKQDFSLLLLVFLFFALFLYLCMEKWAKKREVERFLYDCKLVYKEREVQAKGFLDSGNLARQKGLPVCFISPTVFFDLFGTDIIEGGGQVCDEIAVTTVGGEKKYAVYKGELEIEIQGEKRRKEVYFANFLNMLSRDYEVLLNAFLIEE